jgi:hypothetical protein
MVHCTRVFAVELCSLRLVMDLCMHPPLIVTLIIALPLDQVLQAVVTHLAVQYSLNLILFLAVDESWGWGSAGHQPRMGPGSAKDSVRGHPSVFLLPLSSPTLHLFICIPLPHLCTIFKDYTQNQRLLGLMVRRLPRSQLTDSCRLPTSPSAHTSTASDGLRMHWDRPA